MRLYLVTVALLCGNALARPQEAQPAAQSAHQPAAQSAHQPAAQSVQQGSSTPATIISQTEEINPDGSFKYSYETSNGIKVDQEGEIKTDPNAAAAKSADGEDSGSIQVLKGSFSYTDPEGKTILLKYVADENGFQPEGDHLPTTPAVPAGIARSLEQQKDQPQQQAQPQPLQAAAQPAQAAKTAQPAQEAQPAAAAAQPTQPTQAETKP